MEVVAGMEVAETSSMAARANTMQTHARLRQTNKMCLEEGLHEQPISGSQHTSLGKCLEPHHRIY